MKAKRITINAEIDIKVEAWGFGLTNDGHLVRFLGKSSSDLGTELTVQAVLLPENEVRMVGNELYEVSADRYAPWPTVDKYRPALKSA